MRANVLISAHEGLNAEIKSGRLNFVSQLKACAQKKDLCTGITLHAEILKNRLLFVEQGSYLASALISMYAKCGVLDRAQQVFEELLIRDVASWNALISGYVQRGRFHRAWNSFEWMRSEGVSPNAVTFICIMKACGKTRAVKEGKQIHEEILNKGWLQKDITLCNALIDMYVKCGILWKAAEVFDELSIRDAFSWNVLISGYAQVRLDHEALICFDCMQREGIIPNSVTFICILKVCASARAMDKGKRIHDMIMSRGLLKEDIVLGTALVDMYAKCGMLRKAQLVFEQLSVRDTVSWNTLITGHAQQEQGYEALNCFVQMQNEGFSPDVITFHSVLQACGSTKSLDKGRQIHKHLASEGLLEKDIALGNALLDMYTKCGEFAKAQHVLEELPVRDVVSWNTLAAGYVQQEEAYEALHCFDLMQSEGLSPNAVTYTCVLKACGIIRAKEKGIRIHEEIANKGFLEQDIILGNALVDMYAKCGAPGKAQQVLEGLPEQHVVSWSAVISGYAKQGQGHEALDCFERMQTEGVFPDAVTFICILNACSSVGTIDWGEKLYGEILNGGLLEKPDIVLGTALVDMYAKCGMLEKAQQVLEQIPDRNVVSWCALLTGYAHQGDGRNALICLERMQHEGIALNEVTFLCALSACSHSGLVDESQMLFVSMTEKYGIAPNLEHYTCLVAIYGHGGQFDKAVSVIMALPSSSTSPSIWLALLSACRKWGNVKLGRLAFDQAVQSGCNLGAACVLMGNTFAAAGMQEDAANVEAMRLKCVVSWDDRGRNTGVDAYSSFCNYDERVSRRSGAIYP